MAKKSGTTRKRKASQPAPAAGAQAAPRKARRFWRYCFVIALAGVAVLAWLSMLTFDANDPPSPNVYPPQRAQNAAGIVGAYLSYYLRYYVGGGAYMVLLFATVAAGVMMFGGRISHVPWRVAGACMLMAATSSSLFLHHGSGHLSPINGPAGVLGEGLGGFLASKFGPVGSWIIVLAALLIGVMLTAEKLVLRLPSLGVALWRKRKDLPAILPPLRAKLGADASRQAPEPEAPAAVKVQAKPAPKPPAAAPRAEPPRPEAPVEEKPKLKLRLMPHKKPQPSEPKPPPSAQATPKRSDDYQLPPVDLLAAPAGGYAESQEQAAAEKRDVLQETLNNFNVAAEVVGYMTGPVITMYELSLAPGVKVSQIANLSTDMARAPPAPGP